MRKIIISLFLFCSHIRAQELVQTELLDDAISFLTPSCFKPMPEEIIRPLKKGGITVLSNSTHGVTIAIEHTQNSFSLNDVAKAKTTISKMFHNIYPRAKWFREELITVDGKPAIVFELITPAMDSKIHNIMYMTSLNERLLVITFNTTLARSEKWLPIGHRIMKSISFNE